MLTSSVTAASVCVFTGLSLLLISDSGHASEQVLPDTLPENEDLLLGAGDAVIPGEAVTPGDGVSVRPLASRFGAIGWKLLGIRMSTALGSGCWKDMPGKYRGNAPRASRGIAICDI